VQEHVVPAWMVVMIIGREFAVSGLRGIAAAEGYTIRASELGKTKTIAQVVAISFLLLSIRHPNLSGPAYWMMWAVVAFTFASAVDYFRQFWRKVDARVKLRRRRELLRMERRERQRLAALGQRGSAVGDFRGTI
jgi:CDP-diacylglycerol--glycerol-3-phosphate 3-phosphatidyltransferase